MISSAATIAIEVDGPYGIVEGENRRIRIHVADVLGNDTDVTLACSIRDPAHNVTDHTADVQPDTEGRAWLDKDLDVPGVYVVRVEASGDLQGAAEKRITVHASEVLVDE